MLTASVALAAVALVMVAPLSVAEKPGVLPPAVNPLFGPLAGIVVVWLPVLTELTATENVHEPSGPPEVAIGTVPPDNVTTVPFDGALTVVKPHPSLALGTEAIVTPEARLSVTAAPLSTFKELLNSVTAMVDGSPGLMVAGLNDRLIVAVAKLRDGTQANSTAHNFQPWR